MIKTTLKNLIYKSIITCLKLVYIYLKPKKQKLGAGICAGAGVPTKNDRLAFCIGKCCLQMATSIILFAVPWTSIMFTHNTSLTILISNSEKM